MSLTKISAGKAALFYGRKLNHIYAFVVKPYAILKLMKASVNFVHYVAEYIICRLIIYYKASLGV